MNKATGCFLASFQSSLSARSRLQPRSSIFARSSLDGPRSSRSRSIGLNNSALFSREYSTEFKVTHTNLPLSSEKKGEKKRDDVKPWRDFFIKGGNSSENDSKDSPAVAAAKIAASGGKTLEEIRNNISPIMESVVKIDVVSSAPDFNIPWQHHDTGESSGSGCVIMGPNGKLRVLTNAHVVEDHTFLRLRKQGCPDFFLGRVELLNKDCDLALLSVEDESFFKGTKPVEFADTPGLQETVYVVGYPEGGDSISVTKGIVSRLELSHYSDMHRTYDRGTILLSVQIDAAINPGNSGGPALNEQNKILGIVFAKLGGWSENVGYLVPSEIIKHFLRDAEEGRDPTFCSLAFRYQSCENPSLRKWAQLPADIGGVLVTAVDELSHSRDVLHRGDVVTAIDGVRIASDGTIAAKDAGLQAPHLRLSFEYLIAKKFVGEPIQLELLRDGKKITVESKADNRKYLVPLFAPPSPQYFVNAGLLFVPISEAYLDTLEDSGDVIVGKYFFRNQQQFEDQQVVFLLKVLADEVNVGFTSVFPQQVVALNGTPIKSLQHLIDLVETTESPYLNYELESGECIVLETEQAKESNARIMRRYHIPTLKSVNFSETMYDRRVSHQRGELAKVDIARRARQVEAEAQRRARKTTAELQRQKQREETWSARTKQLFSWGWKPKTGQS